MCCIGTDTIYSYFSFLGNSDRVDLSDEMENDICIPFPQLPQLATA